jgi:hypothetical protein
MKRVGWDIPVVLQNAWACLLIRLPEQRQQMGQFDQTMDRQATHNLLHGRTKARKSIPWMTRSQDVDLWTQCEVV